MTFEARWEEQLVVLQTIAEVSQELPGTIVNFIGTVTGFSDYAAAFTNYDRVWLEDASGAIQVYRGVFAPDLAIGDKYEVEGELDIYQGLAQVKQGSTLTLVNKENTIAAPIVVTDLATILITDQGKRVSFSGVVSITTVVIWSLTLQELTLLYVHKVQRTHIQLMRIS